MARQESFLMRTELLLGADDLAELGRRTVLMAGCGGVGGGAAITLARMGVGGFVLADPGAFDLPDLNRQWGAFRSTLGRNKAEVYQQLIRDINPEASVRTVSEGVTAQNMEDLVGAADLIVDGLDFSMDLKVRLDFYDRAQALDRWLISSPIFGFGTMTLVAPPDGMSMGPVIERLIGVAKTTSKLPPAFKKLFFAEHIAAVEQQVGTGSIPSSAVAATLSAAVQSAEIILLLLKHRHPSWREPLALPQVMITEPLGQKTRVIHHSELLAGLHSSSE
jgi:hypothetical protein